MDALIMFLEQISEYLMFSANGLSFQSGVYGPANFRSSITKGNYLDKFQAPYHVELKNETRGRFFGDYPYCYQQEDTISKENKTLHRKRIIRETYTNKYQLNQVILDEEIRLITNLNELLVEMFQKPFDSWQDGLSSIFTIPMNLLSSIGAIGYDLIHVLVLSLFGWIALLYEPEARKYAAGILIFEFSTVLKDVLFATVGTALLFVSILAKTFCSISAYVNMLSG